MNHDVGVSDLQPVEQRCLSCPIQTQDEDAKFSRPKQPTEVAQDAAHGRAQDQRLRDAL